LLNVVLPALPNDDTISAATLFTRLLVTPLKECYKLASATAPAELVTAHNGVSPAAPQPHPLPRIVLLIDALDEGESELLSVLSAELQGLPVWLSLLLTSRPEQHIRDALASHKPKELYCSQQENREDIEKFLRIQLAEVAPATVEPLDSLVSKLLEKSGGQFLYARLLVNEVRENPKTKLSALPTDLSAYYAESMNRLKERSSAALFKQLFAVIEAVCTFYLPPSLTLLAEFVHKRCARPPVTALVAPAAAAGASASASATAVELFRPVDLSDTETRTDAVQRLLLPLSSLFPFDTEAASVTVYHKTVSDFFTDQRRKISQPDTTVHLTAVHKLIAEICMQQTRTTKSAQSLQASEAGGSAALASAAATGSSAAGPSVLPSLPWLRLLKVDAALSDSARASAGPPTPSAAWLRYAACFAAEHAVDAQSVPLATALLSHPQYLHLRSLYQSHASYLTAEYAQSITRAEEEQCAREEQGEDDEEEEGTNGQAGLHANNPKTECLTSSPLRRSLYLPILRAFYRLYLQHGRLWATTPELVYQTALAFPDDSTPARFALQLLPWLSQWKHRKCAVLQWDNKPQQLSELIGTLNGHDEGVLSVVYLSEPEGNNKDEKEGKKGKDDPETKNNNPGKFIITGGQDHTVRVWDAIDLTEVAKLIGHEDVVSSVSVSPDGRRIVSGSRDQTMRVWDAVNFIPLATLEGHTDDVCSVSYSGDGTRIATGGGDGTIRIWDAVSFAPIGTLDGHRSRVYSIAFSPDGTRIISGSYTTVRVWDAATLVELTTLEGQSAPFHAVAFSPDGSRICSADKEGFLCVWDAHSFDLLQKMKCSEESLSSAAFSPDGTRIVVGGKGTPVRLYDALTLELLKTFSGHMEIVYSVAFSPDGARIVSASYDGTVRVWDATDLRKPIQTREGHDSPAMSLALSSDGRRIVSGGFDQTVRVWDAQTGEEVAVLSGHTGSIDSVSMSADGSRIFASDGFAFRDCTVRVWNGETFEQFGVIDLREGARMLKINPDASRILVGNEDALSLWDARTFEKIASVNFGHANSVPSAAFMPDGSRIVVHCSDKLSGYFVLLHAADLTEIAKFDGPAGWNQALAVSSDGRRIVTAGAAKVHVWDAADFKAIAVLEGHTKPIFSVSFSGDGRFIVSASSDSTVRVWCTSSFRELRKLTGHNNGIFSVAVNHDGSRIVSSGNSESAIRCWSLLAPEGSGGVAAESTRLCHFVSENAGTGMMQLRQLC
jgi:WD40 repeat protein